MDEQPLHTRRFEREPNGSGVNGANSAPPPEHECLEYCPICRTADVLRTAIPPEFQDQWQQLQRDAMLMMRAALDHYIERLDEQRRGGEPPVEDIPIG